MNSSSTLSLGDKPEIQNDPRWVLYLTAFPLPLVQSGGLGGSFEYLFTPRFSANVAYNKMDHIQNNELLGEVDKDINFSYSAGIKFVPYSVGQFDFYIGTGYMMGTVNSLYEPGLLKGTRADKSSNIAGVYGSLGSRFIGQQNNYFTWIFDLALSYNPGLKVEKTYSSSMDSAGNISSSLETELSYGILPMLYVGGLF